MDRDHHLLKRTFVELQSSLLRSLWTQRLLGSENTAVEIFHQLVACSKSDEAEEPQLMSTVWNGLSYYLLLGLQSGGVLIRIHLWELTDPGMPMRLFTGLSIQKNMKAVILTLEYSRTTSLPVSPYQWSQTGWVTQYMSFVKDPRGDSSGWSMSYLLITRMKLEDSEPHGEGLGCLNGLIDIISPI